MTETEVHARRRSARESSTSSRRSYNSSSTKWETFAGERRAYVIYKAYVGLVQNLAPERKTSTIPLDIVRERDVDWKLLQPYLPN